MGKFKVAITEILRLDIEVIAENPDEAEQKARDDWKNGVYILDAGNFVGVIFKASTMDG